MTDFAGSDVTTLGLLRQLDRLRPAKRRRGIAMGLLMAWMGRVKRRSGVHAPGAGGAPGPHRVREG